MATGSGLVAVMMTRSCALLAAPSLTTRSNSYVPGKSAMNVGLGTDVLDNSAALPAGLLAIVQV
ncbi:MAG: hypothetical protein WDO12_01210 [Pseudomonadota bacterium]